MRFSLQRTIWVPSGRAMIAGVLAWIRRACRLSFFASLWFT